MNPKPVREEAETPAETPQAVPRSGAEKTRTEQADGSVPYESTFSVPDYEAYKQEQYDRLARGLRESLDMEKLYELIGLSPDGPADGGC